MEKQGTVDSQVGEQTTQTMMYLYCFTCSTASHAFQQNGFAPRDCLAAKDQFLVDYQRVVTFSIKNVSVDKGSEQVM